MILFATTETVEQHKENRDGNFSLMKKAMCLGSMARRLPAQTSVPLCKEGLRINSGLAFLDSDEGDIAPWGRGVPSNFLCI